MTAAIVSHEAFEGCLSVVNYYHILSVDASIHA